MTSEEIQSTINVQKLISVFENKKNETQSYFRPRAKSLGHLLVKDVVVPVNDLRTLKDIEIVLETVETNLNNYQVYNKSKHVALQEELFNTLTSIINIDTDDPNKAKKLIEKTKILVSTLNNKLPPHNTTIQSNISNQTRTSTISVVLKSTENKNLDTKIEDNEEVKISVKELKEKFKEKDEPIVKKETQTYNKSVLIEPEKLDTTDGLHKNSIQETKGIGIAFPADEDYYDPEPVKINREKVSQLRGLFEIKSQEAAAGIPLILKENKPPITRFNYKSNQSEPEIITNYSSIEISPPESSRLLSLLEKDNNTLHKRFTHELNISKENDEGNVVQVESKYSLYSSQFESMANLEPVEDDGSISEDSLMSNESLNTIEDLKSVGYDESNAEKEKNDDDVLIESETSSMKSTDSAEVTND